MNIVLLLAGLGVAGAVLALVAFRYWSSKSTDMGSVSHTWVAELRAGEPYDSSR